MRALTRSAPRSAGSRHQHLSCKAPLRARARSGDLQTSHEQADNETKNISTQSGGAKSTVQPASGTPMCLPGIASRGPCA